jgi:hypothetical protein
VSKVADCWHSTLTCRKAPLECGWRQNDTVAPGGADVVEGLVGQVSGKALSTKRTLTFHPQALGRCARGGKAPQAHGQAGAHACARGEGEEVRPTGSGMKAAFQY